MAAAILRGDPDALLTQPKAVLPRLLAGESLAHGWGDLVTGSATLATLAGLDAARLMGPSCVSGGPHVRP